MSWSKLSMTSIQGLILATTVTSSPTAVSFFLQLQSLCLLLFLNNDTYISVSEHVSLLFPLLPLDSCIAWSPISFRSLLKCHLITQRSVLTTLCKICLLFSLGSRHFLFPYPVLRFTLIIWHIFLSYLFIIFLPLLECMLHKSRDFVLFTLSHT